MDKQSELEPRRAGSHLEPVLQVLGFQALPLGQLRMHTAGERRDAFLLLRNFLLRTKGVKTFSILHVGESFSS